MPPNNNADVWVNKGFISLSVIYFTFIDKIVASSPACSIVHNNITANKEMRVVGTGHANALLLLFEIRDESWNYNNAVLLPTANGRREFYKECLSWCRDIAGFYKTRDTNVLIFLKKLLDKIICHTFLLRYFMLCVVFNSPIHKWNDPGGERWTSLHNKTWR